MDETMVLNKLRDGLARRLAHVQARFHPATAEYGAALILDRADRSSVFVMWNAQEGFLVSSDVERQPEARKERTLPDIMGAMELVVAWFVRRPKADPVGLAELRGKAGVRQSELARRLKVKQPSVAGIERPGRLARMGVGKLARAVEALGGRLKITATMDDGAEWELALAPPS